MKGTVTRVSGHQPPMATPHRVGQGGNVRGLTTKVGSTKTSAAGGFTASRKAGSVRGNSMKSV